MKCRYYFVIVIIAMLLVSCGEKATKKAQEFMEARMYEQAIALLDQEIQKKPKNATAHFLMGECKLMTNRLGEAEEAFKRATVLQPDLGMQIGEVAISAAKIALSEKEYQQALQIMSLAQKYDPETAKTSATLCMDTGKSLLENQEFDESLSLLQYTVSSNQSLQNEVSNILLNTLTKEIPKGGDTSQINRLASLCVQFNPSHVQKIGQLYFDLGQSLLHTDPPLIDEAVSKGFSLAIKFDSSLSSQAAKKFMDVRMYEQAKVFLNEGIIKETKNADLHFLLGKCLLATNEIHKAQESFDRAIHLDVNKGTIIGTSYLEEGKVAFKAGDLERANSFFSLAFKYDPSLGKKEIASIYANAAIDRIKSGQLNTAQSLSLSAKFYDPEIIHQISAKAMEKANAIADPNQIETITSLGKLGVSLTPNEANNWGTLIYQIISKSPQSLNAADLVVIGGQGVEWNPNLRNEILKLYFDQTSKALQSKDSLSVSTFLKAAVRIDSNVAQRAAQLVWDELTENFDSLSSFGSRNFLTLFKLSKDFGLSSEYTKSLDFDFANALQLYQEGFRERAIAEFKKVAIESSPNSVIKKVAQEILAPPTPGTYNINSTPFRFTGTRGSGMGWGGSKGLDIALVKVKVDEKEIHLVFSLKAEDKPDKLLFIPEEKEIHYGVISGKELLHIIDDNGKTFTAMDGFKGGIQEDFNDTVKEINIQAFEEVLVTVSFPMVSPGSTNIRFVSPRLNGWQTDWRWDNIVLKKGPFDELPFFNRTRIIFQDGFTDNRNRWWEGDTDEVMKKVENGKYLFEHKRKERGWFARKQIVINQSKDFQIKATVKKINGVDEYGYGIVWGLENTKKNYYEFGINGNGSYYYGKMVNNEWHKIIDWSKSKHINKYNSTNTLSIKKSETRIQFFINNHYVDEAKFEGFWGDYVGFILHRNMRIEIDHIIIEN